MISIVPRHQTSRFVWLLLLSLVAADDIRGDEKSPTTLTAIRVSQNGKYFETLSGRPFFWMGDTVWNGPMLAKEADWEEFLADRKTKKFSVIQFNVCAPWRTAAADENGRTAYTGFDTITIDEAYFARLDKRMKSIAKHGMVAAPVLLWTLGDKKESPGQLPEGEAVKLAKYVVARYGKQPVCWILPGDGKYEGETAAKWKRIGRQVFGDKGEHAPVTLHPQGMQWPFETFREEPWVGFFGYQSGHGDDPNTLKWIHTGPLTQARDKTPVRPILNLEPPYEEHIAYQSKKPHSAFNVRRACYWSCLVTPTCGVTYGGHGIWSWQEQPGVPRNHAGSGQAKAWREAKDLPGAAQMKHLVTCFESVQWWELTPDNSLLAEQPGTKEPARFIAAASTPGRKQILVYVPAGDRIVLRAADFAPLKSARWQWFDPRTGEERPAAPSADGTSDFIPPDGQDWVLITRAM